MKRAFLLLVALAALAAGLAGGLTYAWLLAPVEYGDVAPDSLHIQDKLVYAALIGDLYVCEQDLERAESRLAALALEADGPAVARLIENYLDSGGQPEEIRNLAQLAHDLGASGGVLLVFGPELAPTPQATPSATATQTPQATSTPAPTPTPAPVFRLLERTALCAEPGAPGEIAVWVQDAAGNELAGVEVVASWSGGQDRFFTGLRPDKGPGYADFEMSPGVEYTVSLGQYSGEMAEGLSSQLQPGLCPTQTLALDWRLVFEQIP